VVGVFCGLDAGSFGSSQKAAENAKTRREEIRETPISRRKAQKAQKEFRER